MGPFNWNPSLSKFIRTKTISVGPYQHIILQLEFFYCSSSASSAEFKQDTEIFFQFNSFSTSWIGAILFYDWSNVILIVPGLYFFHAYKRRCIYSNLFIIKVTNLFGNREEIVGKETDRDFRRFRAASSSSDYLRYRLWLISSFSPGKVTCLSFFLNHLWAQFEVPNSKKPRNKTMLLCFELSLCFLLITFARW